MPDRILAITGATATGKTALAVAVAKELGGVIINADSMQIYKDMRIGTAKPSADELDGVECLLTDFIAPDGEYNVCMYKHDAREAIRGVLGSGRLPLLCGGTGLYIDTLLENTSLSVNSKDDTVRAQLMRELEADGSERMFERLHTIDPETASHIHINDTKRLIRAMEIYLVTGRTRTEWDRLSKLEPPEYEALRIFLTFRDRDKLYERINRRVDAMFVAGLVAEARRIYDNYDRSRISAIGYPQLFEYFDGIVSLDEAKENIKRATRNYAKRQLTWFRRNTEAKVMFADECSECELAEGVIKEYTNTNISIIR